MRGRVGPGSDTGNSLKNPMKMMRAHSGAICQLFKSGNFVRCLDGAAGRDGCSLVTLDQWRGVRLAAFARTKTFPFRVGHSVMERDVFPPRSTSRAGWSTVDARRLDRIVKPTVV